MCSYLIDADQVATNLNPLPDDPKIGWGPGQNLTSAGLEATTHKEAVVETETGEVEIRFDKKDPLAVMQELKNNDLEEWMLKNNAVLRIEDKEVILNIRLPKIGEYALKMFADEENTTADLQNVCNYLIKCKDTQQQDNPYPPTYNGILGSNPILPKLEVTQVSQEKIIETKEHSLDLKFKHSNKKEMFCEVTHKKLSSESLSADVKQSSSSTGSDFKINVPQNGEYGLNFFVRSKVDDGSSRVHHVGTYLLKSDGDAQPSDEAIQKEEVIKHTVSVSYITYHTIKTPQ